MIIVARFTTLIIIEGQLKPGEASTREIKQICSMVCADKANHSTVCFKNNTIEKRLGTIFIMNDNIK